MSRNFSSNSVYKYCTDSIIGDKNQLHWEKKKTLYNLVDRRETDSTEQK